MKKLLLIILLVSNYTYAQVIPRISGTCHVVNKPDHEPPEIINKYAAALAFDICTNSITVDDVTGFGPGDTVLVIQMKGALPDTSNTAAFGTILDYKNAGNYEFNFISQRAGNVLTLQNKLVRSYDIPDGVVQLVRIPKYKSGYFSGGLTCDSWDGVKGGIIAVHSTMSLRSVEDIYVTGRGFRGAAGYNAVNSTGSCNQDNYYFPATSDYAALRGESIGIVSQNKLKGKGKIAAGGGGGNSHNSGGGGGGNGGTGGHGGYQTDSCNAVPLNNGGVGGGALLYNNTANKIFMGSGGGAGHIDNSGVTVPRGGNGGGIIILITDELEMFEEYILANGEDAGICGAINCNDGNGGGGGGGTILLSYTSITGNVIMDTRGGKGANMDGALVPGGRSGPGGGGGGGVTFVTGSSFPVNVGVIPTGGMNGVIPGDSNNAWGATAGNDGVGLFNLSLPWATVPFKPNIDSVRMLNSANYCNNIQFNGFGFTNAYSIASWYWDFGDGGMANTQNPIHNYNAVGNYNVKLVITDINGCKDSIITTINTAGPMFANAGADSALCAGGFVSIPLRGNGTGNSYSWSPASVLNNSSLQNPVATIDAPTKFYLSISNGTGCSAIDSVTITINKNPLIKTLKDTSICQNTILVLTTTGAVSYNWSPGIYVSDSTIANPQYINPAPHTLYVTGTGANGCKAVDTINIDVKNPVTFLAPPNESICKGRSVKLNGNNGNIYQYTWSPNFYLSNPNIKSPVANPPVTTAYTVTIKDNACNYDSSFVVDVTVFLLPMINTTKSNDINCNKPFAQLNAAGASTYTWSPAFALNNSSIANPLANPVSSTTYYVTGTDNNGCSNTDSIKLVVIFGNGILLPNSFTPNGDGINDCFGINYYRDVKDLEFIIYNRYGNIIFQTKNAAECWNGNYKGQPADPGSYVYFLKANTLCGYIQKKGTLTLLR